MFLRPLFLLLSITVFTFGISSSKAQEDNAIPTKAGEVEVIETLESVSETIPIIDRQVQDKRAALQTAETPADKGQLTDEIAALNEKKLEAQANFDSIAAGVSIVEFDAAHEQGFVLKEEVDELLEPLVPNFVI